MTREDSTVTIRRAGPGDAEALDRLFRYLDAFHAEARPDMFRMPEGSPRGEDFLPGVLADPLQAILVAATAAGAVVGYVHVRVKQAPGAPYRVARRYGEIDNLAVLPEAQGQGVGRRLIEGALDWLAGQGVDDHQIAVHAFNTAAMRLYARLGFVPSVTMLRRKG
jgi:ribosomal protein S18 acetylase RimI-like enzyme